MRRVDLPQWLRRLVERCLRRTALRRLPLADAHARKRDALDDARRVPRAARPRLGGGRARGGRGAVPAGELQPRVEPGAVRQVRPRHDHDRRAGQRQRGRLLHARAAVTGEFEGYVCPNDTFGRPNKTYGLVDVECTKCLENTHTNADGSTSQAECLTDAGYGYDDGAVNMCDYGSYNPGDNQAACTQCGAFYNTSADGVAAATAGRLGADSPDDCKPDFGWTNDTAGGLKPCVQGYYKDTLGWGACTQW